MTKHALLEEPRFEQGVGGVMNINVDNRAMYRVNRHFDNSKYMKKFRRRANPERWYKQKQFPYGDTRTFTEKRNKHNSYYKKKQFLQCIFLELDSPKLKPLRTADD